MQGAPRTGNHSANLKSVPDGSGGYTGGILYRNYVGNQKPLILAGYWRGTFASDFFGQFHIRINVYDSSHNIIGSGDAYSPMATNLPNWTSFSLTVNYTSSDPPASVDIWIVLNSLQAAVNSFIDDLSLTYDVGIHEINDVNLFSYSPNPTTNELVVSSLDFGDKSEIEIYNVLGEKVLTQQQTTNVKQQIVDVSQLPSGIYFISVKTSRGTSSAKFVKE